MSAPVYPAGSVLEVKVGGYMVASRTTPGVFYMVSGKDCTCKAGQTGNEVCFHRTQTARFVRALNEQHKRPVAPVNVTALCD